MGLGGQAATLYQDTKREITFIGPFNVYNAVVSHTSFHGTSMQALKEGKGGSGRGRVRTLPVCAKTVSEAVVYQPVSVPCNPQLCSWGLKPDWRSALSLLMEA